MKFRNLLPAAMAVLVTCMLSGSAQAGISGSKHDFGQFGWANNQICQPCHTPHSAIVHDAQGVKVDGPIWNHELSTATYTLYAEEPTAGAGVTGKVDTNSMLCLSCHDGTVALDSFGGGGGSGSSGQQLSGGLVGTDLSDDHPIGEAAVWPTGATYMVDPSLRDTAHIMPLRKLADGRLVVGCTSCHEPHNRKNTAAMLWVKNSGTATTVDSRTVSGSALCLNCHKK